MLQKLGLASVILSGKRWLVLDEPMSGLDPAARRLMVQAITQARSAGQGVLFTTHALQGLDALCDRIALIHDGRLVFLGTVQTLLERHDSADLESAFLSQIQQETLQ